VSDLQDLSSPAPQAPVPPFQTEDASVPELSPDELRFAYRAAVASRALEEIIVRMASRGEIKFATWGTGEEVHGVATALALSKAVNPDNFAFCPHYRSGPMMNAWCHLRGVDNFHQQLVRQQLTRATDGQTGGRQMPYHMALPEVGILPVQSPVGMQLGKAAGYAKGFHLKGIDDGVTMAIVGDGTTAEGDLHDAMNAASVWQLPLIVLVTDNGVAISTRPNDGRGIKDFKKYAEAFGLRHFECDGRDFDDVYETTYQAARHARTTQTGVVLHARYLPRLNGHSSAADMTFDLSQPDPLLGFGEALVEKGLLDRADVVRRLTGTEGRDYFTHHDLGRVMQAEFDKVSVLLERTRTEPEPDPAGLEDHIYAPFPQVEEPDVDPDSKTCVSYAGAIRAALDHIIGHQGGVLWGEDVGNLGGVMQATAGLARRHPERVIDSPLNEPLIVGTACGAGLHDGVVALPEIQFGDYSLNAMHWLVYLGNMHWSTMGQASSSLVLRMPTDPFGGGALYHSMSVDGYFTPIPGLVIIMPSTSWDAYGLLRTAGDYNGPTVCLEPKWMYRQSLGPAFPGEPTDAAEVAALKKSIMRGEVPDIVDMRVPFSKAAFRRRGTDVTIVAWGRAVWTSLAAAHELERQGLSAEVIDLRTLVPPDMDTVVNSVRRTGSLVVAAEDRAFAGFGRTIQGLVAEAVPGAPTRTVGQKNLPGIAQAPALEKASVLSQADVVSAAKAVTEIDADRPGWNWVPGRYS